MKNGPKPARAVVRLTEGSAAPGPGAAAIGLALGWIAIPGLQYAGSYVRSQVQLDLAFGRRSDLDLHGVEVIALWDLTPLYALLLLGTAIFALRRWLSSRSAAA